MLFPKNMPNRSKALRALRIFGVLAGVGCLLCVYRICLFPYVESLGISTPPPVQNASGEQERAAFLAEIKAQRRIIDVHEHMASSDLAPMYLRMMEELGIGRMCLMGSSKFTLTMNEQDGFSGYDENNQELLNAVKRYPDRLEAWVTINPLDDRKLEKFQEAVAHGARGLKLYIGHGYLTRQNRYMFHPIAMDDPRMLPLYDYCQAHNLPACIHVNPDADRPGFAEEFIAVLTAFPDLKVICPHMMLSSVVSVRLEEFLDVFPNVYSDISFGDTFLPERLQAISDNPGKFRYLFSTYPDRFMYGADLVLTRHPGRTEQWIREQHTAYLNMLSQATYRTPLVPGRILNGLALPNPLLERVLYKNYEDFMIKNPHGTHITRKIDFRRLGVQPTGRVPGQAIPPPQ